MLLFSYLVVFYCLFFKRKSAGLDTDHTGGGIAGTKKPSRGGLIGLVRLLLIQLL